MSEMQSNVPIEDLSFLDDMLAKAEESTSSGGPRSDLSVCYLKDHDFTFRLVLDSNKELFNEFRFYRSKIKSVNEKGEEVERTVRYRPPVVWDEDPVRPYAEEFNNYMYNAQRQITFFGEIVEVTKGADKYFKPGPCILVTRNKKFLQAVASAMTALNKKMKGTDPVGKRILAQALDPYQVGYLLNIRATSGQQGTVNASFDTVGDPEHKIDPDIAKQFDDIKKVLCPSYGPENDRNGALIIEEYKKQLKDRNNYVQPEEDAIESTNSTESTEADKPQESFQPADLDAAINNAETPA